MWATSLCALSWLHVQKVKTKKSLLTSYVTYWGRQAYHSQPLRKCVEDSQGHLLHLSLCIYGCLVIVIYMEASLPKVSFWRCNMRCVSLMCVPFQLLKINLSNIVSTCMEQMGIGYRICHKRTRIKNPSDFCGSCKSSDTCPMEGCFKVWQEEKGKDKVP